MGKPSTTRAAEVTGIDTAVSLIVLAASHCPLFRHRRCGLNIICAPPVFLKKACRFRRLCLCRTRHISICHCCRQYGSVIACHHKLSASYIVPPSVDSFSSPSSPCSCVFRACRHRLHTVTSPSVLPLPCWCSAG